jgi:Protein of unknown function (DUF4238)
MAEGKSGTQHYVPQLILRRFANGKDQVQVYDKWTRRHFPSSPRNMASEMSFYDLTTETGSISIDPVLSHLEVKVAPILKSVIEARSVATLTEPDRKAVAIFVATQMMRTLGARQRLQQTHEGVLAAFEARGLEVPAEFHTDEEEIKRSSLAAIVESAAIVPLILDKTWMLGSASAEYPFMVSDNPLVRCNTTNPATSFWGTDGLACEGVEIYMPLTPTLTLCFHCKSIVGQLRTAAAAAGVTSTQILDVMESGVAMEPHNEVTKFQNSLQVQAASRFLFSFSDDFSLVEEMLDAHPEFAKPQYVLVT